MTTKLLLFTATTCTKCPEAKKVVKEVAKELKLKEGTDYVIKNVDEGDNLVEALTYQVASTPSIIINGIAEFRGVVPKKSELLNKLKA